MGLKDAAALIREAIAAYVQGVCNGADTAALLISGGEDSLVKVWDIATGRQLLELTGHQSPVRAVAVSPNGKTLVSTGEDAQILVWDSATGQLRKSLTGNQRPINSLKFEPDGRLLTGDDDGQIINWDVETDEKLKTLKPISQSGGESSSTESTGLPASTAAFDAGSKTRVTTLSEWQLSTANFVARLLEWMIPPAAALPCWPQSMSAMRRHWESRLVLRWRTCTPHTGCRCMSSHRIWAPPPAPAWSPAAATARPGTG